MITHEEARERSNAKIQQIKELANKLQVRMTAEQAIRNNMIKNVILYTDEEVYDIEPVKPVVRPPLPPRAQAFAEKKGEVATGKKEEKIKGPNVQNKEAKILSSDEDTIPQQ